MPPARSGCEASMHAGCSGALTGSASSGAGGGHWPWSVPTTRSSAGPGEVGTIITPARWPRFGSSLSPLAGDNKTAFHTQHAAEMSSRVPETAARWPGREACHCQYIENTWIIVLTTWLWQERCRCVLVALLLAVAASGHTFSRPKLTDACCAAAC